MAYKSLLTLVADDATLDRTLTHLEAHARKWDAHADVFCVGVDNSQPGFAYASANAMIMQENIDRAGAEARAMGDVAECKLAASDLRYSVEVGLAQVANLGHASASRARFADLVVLPKPYGSDRGVEAEVLVESAMFEGRAPVLVVPDADEPNPNPTKILLAWNESAEALAAARAALPHLKAADSVRLVVIDPDPHSAERSDPGGMLAQMLSRHDVKVEIDVLGRSLPRVSDVLLRHITDTAADMVVMGAYGHSRLREALLGGATRDMLEQIPVPVLMAR